MQAVTQPLCLFVHVMLLYVRFHQIARLREEGSRQLEEEQRLIREQIQREREAQQQQTGGHTHKSMSQPKI